MRRIAVWELGFRPFYLLGSAFAALSIAAWAAQYAGWLPSAYLRGTTWHGHEMLFGYTMAIVAGFLFTAVRNWTGRPTPLPGTLATHALTIGVIGGMTLGMMTRTARGHTGRLLVAGRAEVACYVLVQLAALVRVLGGWISPQWYLATVIGAAACWSAAFTIYAVRYLPILTLPRVDGKPG